MRYSEATKIERISADRWRGDLAENWDITGVTNGGYMQSMAAKAASAAADGRLPVSVTGHFTRPAHTGPVEISTEIVRSGRRFSVVRARMTQDEQVVLETLGTYSNPADAAPQAMLVDAKPPDIPDPDSCVRLLPADGAPFPPPFMGQIDVRLSPGSAQAFQGSANGRAVIEGWFRLLDDETLDAHSLILMSDAFPPTAFVANLPIGWTPTLELTVHIRNPRPAGWVSGQLTSRFITGGLIEEDGLFWDEDGALLAQSRQLALVHQA